MRSPAPLTRAQRDRLESIAMGYGLTLERLRKHQRDDWSVAARRECFTYLVAQGFSYPQAGEVMNRDHTTVIWALSPRRPEKLERLREYTRRVSAERRAS